MNRSEFLLNQSVQDFVSWLQETIEATNFSLNIKASRFVPGGLGVNTTGISETVRNYRWVTQLCPEGTFSATQETLNRLANELRATLSQEQNDSSAALNVCKQILRWGGNRRWDVGAWPFLQQLADTGCLKKYLNETSETLCLANANTDLLGGIKYMNAMLTKVHALASTDGLPIYDSRVAAAMGTLVEGWRYNCGAAGEEIPDELAFPATDSGRTVAHVSPGSILPGFVSSQPDHASAWASAKIRCGWILEASLSNSRILEDFGTNRMRAFEAGLFMLGYNPTSMAAIFAQDSPPSKQAKRSRMLQRTLPKPDTELTKTVHPLSGRGTPIKYQLDEDGSIDFRWGKARALFSRETIDELMVEYMGQEIPLGASRTGPLPQPSLGAWLSEHGYDGAKYASALAPILVAEEGVISQGNRPITLTFPNA